MEYIALLLKKDLHSKGDIMYIYMKIDIGEKSFDIIISSKHADNIEAVWIVKNMKLENAYCSPYQEILIENISKKLKCGDNSVFFFIDDILKMLEDQNASNS